LVRSCPYARRYTAAVRFGATTIRNLAVASTVAIRAVAGVAVDTVLACATVLARAALTLINLIDHTTSVCVDIVPICRCSTLKQKR
jgi:hypothetical protein